VTTAGLMPQTSHILVSILPPQDLPAARRGFVRGRKAI
jgi:hypothetical protein